MDGQARAALARGSSHREEGRRRTRLGLTPLRGSTILGFVISAPGARSLRRLLPALALFSLASLAHAAVRVYPTDEIRPGLKVHAYTVFQGTAVDSFPLEVLGVTREGKATGDLILARATDPRVEHTGIVAGMSGSPVYAEDGRLLGALAYGWGFSKDPICGIEPAQDMVRLWSLPDQSPPGDFTGGGSTPASAGSSSSSLPTLRTPLAVSGLAPEALKLLEPWADQHGFVLTPGGAAGPAVSEAAAGAGGAPASKGGARPRLAPGDAVAVDVLRGDAGMSAIGTVTAVDGDRILAFGHPFFFNGPTRLPISTAEITAVLPSLENSFKIGHPVTAVGTLTQDRRAGIAGVLGRPPSMLPVTVRVSGLGAPPDTFRYQAARQRQLVPTALQVATVSSVLSRGGIPSEGTMRWKLSARFRAGTSERTMQLDDIAAGEAFSAVSDMIGPVGDLLDNSWTPVELEALDYDIQVQPRAEALTVRSVQLDRPRARPGQIVRALVEVESYRGPIETETLTFRVPDTMPAQTLVLFVGGGNDWARFDAQAAPGRYAAHSLDELVDRLQNWPKSSRLYLAVYGANREVTIRGRDYPGLPRSTQVLLTQPDTRDLTSRWGRASLLDQSSRDLDRYVSGGATLQLEVTPKALSPSLRGPRPALSPEDEDRDDTED